MKPDYAHKMTDAELAKLEQRIAKLYKKAADELTDTVKSYFEQFAKRDAAMKEKLDAGEITEQQYKQWRLAQIGRGKRFEALRDKVAERYTDANATAVAYVNDATPGIYSLNRNYAAYKIEQVSDKADFTLWDEQTVKRLIVEQPDLMPYYPPKRALQRGIDLKYGKQQITASVTSSILQGKSIPKIANDLQQRMRDMSRASAIRTARTAVTAAQNAGRLDTYRAAQDMGIKLKKRWLATLDNRTRHAHAMLDGQTVDVDKPFKVDGYELMYPGDSSAPGYLVYNCFVGETQIATDSKIVRSYKHTYKGDLIEVKTACGINFTCTPNHPILTPYGWVAAALLHNGDNLVVTFERNTGSFRRNSNIKHIHSSMKALYNSLHCFGLMSRDSTLRINFHGDIPTTNVEVITKKWLLRNSGNSGVRQGINKFLLKNTNKPFMSQCPFMKHFWSVCKAALRFISSKCQTLALLWRSLFHSNIHGFRTVSWRDVGVTQDTINNLTAKSETIGKVLDGFSGEIAVDKVVSVKIIPFGQTATHVYNLQTQNGYYFVNSSIPQSGTKCNGIFAIAKNCRCTQIAEVDGEDTSSGGRRARDPETGESVLVKDMTYAEWAGWKKPSQPQMPRFTPATTIEEAQKYADKFVESYKTKYSGKVDYSGIDIEYANKMNRAFTEVLEQYAVPNKLRNIVPFNTREKRFKDTTAEAAYQWGLSDFYYNKKYLKSAKTMAAHKKEYADLLEKVLPNIDKAIEINEGKSNATATLQLRYLKALKNTGRTNVFEPDAYGTTIHELGHYLDDQIFTKAAKESGLDITESFNNYSGKISAYATSSRQEYVAESFAAYWKGEKDIIDPKLFDLFERLKNGK
ncbi:phage minor head protein [Gemmiger formicilis]|uniref:phage minor head protein n=1 Tax=Gemmiger formicilis TaxID=745368 RepID=UPI003A2B2BAD